MTETYPNDPLSREPPDAGPRPGPNARLVERLRQGDAEASHRFVREYYPGIYRYLLYLTGRRETAEDLTQETFVQAWRRLETFDDRGPLRPWLHRIAHREFLQALRSGRSEASLEEIPEAAAPHSDRVTEVELRAAMAGLPSEQREVLVLHHLEGYSYQEIARIVAAPVSTVKYRLTAARAYLQRELGEGDLPYLNAPSLPMCQWAWLPLEQMSALEARLVMGSVQAFRRPGVQAFGGTASEPDLERPNAEPLNAPYPSTEEEPMERREFLRHAAAGAAGMVLPAEKEVIDHRLTCKVTLSLKATALSDLCEHLRSTTGIHLVAGNSVVDEKVTVFCEKTPLREVMRQLSRPFGYAWMRSGTPGEYRYEVAQDLKSQLLEEELRNRDRHAALLALEKEIERYRPYLDLSPDEALARASTVSPGDRAVLERLAGYGWGAIQMIFRLTPQQHSALRAGEELRFSQEPKLGTPPLPSEVAHGVLQSLRDVFFTQGPDGFGLALGVQEPAPQHIRPTALPEARATVSLSIRETEPGRIALMYDAGTFSQSDRPNSGGSWRQGDGTLAIGANPGAVRPNNHAANARLAAAAPFRRRTSVRPEGHCQAPAAIPADGSRGTATAAEKRATTADVLEALHRATGLPIVADYYTRLYSPASLTVTEQPLFDALNQLSDAMHLRWSHDAEGGWLQFRSASFYDDRVKEVPKRLLTRWTTARRQHGQLALDDLVEIARLTDAQLDGHDMAEGARECFGLAEWDLARSRILRPHLRFLGELTPAQRQEAMSPAGLAFTKLSLTQQQRYIALAMQFEEQPLRSLEELEGATLRVEYTRPGRYRWFPSASNLHRWVISIERGPEGRRGLLPPVEGRTREEALAAAGRLDARLRDAIQAELLRTKPQIPSAPAVAEAGEIVPTDLNLYVVYIPGLSNRRNILVVDRQSNASLSSR